MGIFFPGFNRIAFFHRLERVDYADVHFKKIGSRIVEHPFGVGDEFVTPCFERRRDKEIPGCRAIFEIKFAFEYAFLILSNEFGIGNFADSARSPVGRIEAIQFTVQGFPCNQSGRIDMDENRLACSYCRDFISFGRRAFLRRGKRIVCDEQG